MMSQFNHPVGAAAPTGHRRNRFRALLAIAAQDIGRGLSLGAAPAFAGLAALTAAFDEPATGCMPGPPATSFGGMVTMYLAMSVVHLAPWLTLASARLGRKRRA